jgi:hypothetical protein
VILGFSTNALNALPTTLNCAFIGLGKFTAIAPHNLTPFIFQNFYAYFSPPIVACLIARRIADKALVFACACLFDTRNRIDGKRS